MELATYNGEYFERNKLWYVVFFLIIGAVIIGSIFSKNTIGAVIILLFVGGYFFFLTKTNEPITIQIEESGLIIGKKRRKRNEFSGFVLEYHTKKQIIHNIVFITPKGHEIYTIIDTSDMLKTFATALGNYLPLLEDYPQTFWEKFLRKIKL